MLRLWMKALGLAAAGALLVAGCGAGGDDGTRIRADAASTELGIPPFPPGQGSVLQSVAQRWLVVVDGRSVATYDFSRSRWALLPDAPQPPNAVMAVGSSVVLIGTKCEAHCSPDDKYPVIAASYDLAEDSSAWRVKDLAVPSWEPKFLGVQVAGEQDGATIFAGFGSL